MYLRITSLDILPKAGEIIVKTNNNALGNTIPQERGTVIGRKLGLTSDIAIVSCICGTYMLNYIKYFGDYVTLLTRPVNPSWFTAVIDENILHLQGSS